MSEITVKINGKSYRAEAGQTILEIARKYDIDIPTLCYHPKLSIVGACRMCV
ncbi:MAG: 2Fe-2S iron-sulfur cluster-binding protein, partial [Bacillota bacterium]